MHPRLALAVNPRARMRRHAAILGCTLACLLTSPLARPGPVPWSEAPYSFYADKMSIDKVLRNFASTFSLALDLSPKVSGIVNGRFQAKSPTEFLDQMAAVYGLHWFTYAGTLHVSRVDEMTTASVVASGTTIGALHRALTDLGVVDARWGWGELTEQGLALVSGPPAYVALVRRTVQSLPLVAGGQQVLVVRLKHASVDDRVVTWRDREITTPGLARVLRNLVLGGDASGLTSVSGGSAVVAQLASRLDLSAPVPPAPSITDRRPIPGAGPGSVTGGAIPHRADGSRVPSPGQRPLPSIQGDTRLNALIIQDTPDRLPMYRALIEQLDVSSALIEIEALIIDVNSARLDELGIAWGGRKGGIAAGFGDVSQSNNSISLSGAAASANISTITTVLNAGNYFVSRIRALETIGEASIQSRPSILTIDHTGALLDLSETFYIRTTGERVATVTPVTVGTTLKVTPHYVERPGFGPTVQLDVDIEDGQIQDREVDTLPTVRRSNVSTQAIVGENQTLLIGGYNTQQRIKNNSRVPGLGSIPLIGALFSHKGTELQARERLFLIKPRLVALDSRMIGDPTDARDPVPVSRIAPPPGREVEVPMNGAALPPVNTVRAGLADSPVNPAATRAIQPAVQPISQPEPMAPTQPVALPQPLAPTQPSASAPGGIGVKEALPVAHLVPPAGRVVDMPMDAPASPSRNGPHPALAGQPVESAVKSVSQPELVAQPLPVALPRPIALAEPSASATGYLQEAVAWRQEAMTLQAAGQFDRAAEARAKEAAAWGNEAERWQRAGRPEIAAAAWGRSAWVLRTMSARDRAAEASGKEGAAWHAAGRRDRANASWNREASDWEAAGQPDRASAARNKTMMGAALPAVTGEGAASTH